MNHKYVLTSSLFLCQAFFFFAGINSGVGAQTLGGHIPPVVRSLSPTGNLPSTNQMHLAIALPLRNQAALSNLLQEIYDPASTNFHHYLSSEEFAERFGPSDEDYEALKTFAKKNGLTPSTTHPNHVLLDVTGSAADVQQTFHLRLRTYRHPTENRIFYAPDSEPTVDSQLPILHISGLSDFALPRPHIVSMQPAVSGNASGNAGSGPGGAYMGNDFRIAYVPDTTLTGAGQAVGLLQFDGYTAADITYYENMAGLPNVPLQNVLIDGASGAPSGRGGEVEVSLDIEDAISMAPGLSKVILYIAPNPSPFVDILNRMATDNQAKQLSCSWYVPNGASEPAADQILQQMAVQGQTFYSASGDYDAFTGLIPFPGDSPYITQVGGTTLTTGSGGVWSSETVWNWGITRGENGIGSGGGISTQYSIPSWQTNISMVSNQGSTTQRNVPDVALTADNVYVRVDGRDNNVGGTSCAAPLWAGFTALVNQEAVASGRSTVGFINPALDAIGTGPIYGTTFHDITTGNNTWSSSPTKFYAAQGYDLCTGWGTPAGQHLIDALANPEPLLILPAAGFSSAGGPGGPFTITSENLTLTNAGSNSLVWTLTNVPAWLTVSSSGGTLTAGGPATTLVVRLNTAASNLMVGNYSATIFFTNLNDHFGQSRQFNLSVVSPPAITLQPSNQAVLERASAQFNVSATGGLPLTYQWRCNGTNLTDGPNISGSGTSNLMIQVVSSANVGAYSVLITNIAGSVQSSSAELSVVPSVPVIVQQPTDQSIYVGMNAQFSVSVVGTTPYSYQWGFDGMDIPDATNALFVLSNAQFGDAGTYAVSISNTVGVTVSSDANLTVNPPPPCVPPPSGIVGWWSAENSAADIIGTNNGALVGGAGYAPGLDGQAFVFANVGDEVIATTGGLPIGTSDRTIECWAYFDSFISGGEATIACYGNPGGYGQAYLIYVDQNQHLAFSQWGNNVTGPMVYPGQWYHVAVTSMGNSNIVLYLNGENVASGALSFSTPAGSTLYIGHVNPTDLTRQLIGEVDELSIYNRALTSDEIAAIYNSGGQGKCSTPVGPYIVSQSSDQTVPISSYVAMQVIAGGSPPLTYQWTFNGATVAGATNSAIIFTNAQLTNSGVYAVSVQNPYGSALSPNINLTVYPVPPSITTEPTDQTVSVGGTTSFTVGATGPPPLFYQWTFNGTNIANATKTILSLTNVQTNQAGAYAVIVTNNYGSATSSDANLTVNWFPPAITSQPSNVVALVSTNVTFTVTATGSPPLSYQWTFNSVPIAGATKTVLTFTNVQLSQSGTYAVIVTNAFGSITSSNANLTVYGTPPTITSQPSSQLVNPSNNVNFTVTATGSPPFSYQWKFNGVKIANATNNPLTLTNVQVNQSGSYAVTVTNAFGSTNSANATLTVNPLPPCDPPPSGLVGWWQAENNGADIAGTNNATLIGGVGYTNGRVGQAFHFSAVGDQVMASTGGLPVGTSDRTMECWVYFNSFLSGAEATIAGYGAFGNNGQVYLIYLNPSHQLSFSQWGNAITGPALNAGQWYHLAVTSVGTNNITLYVNGASVINGGLPFSTPSNTSFYIGGVTASPYSTRQTVGQIDEVSIYNRALSSNEIAAIYNAGGAGKCPLAPGILVQPLSQTVTVGSNATFSVTAKGSPPLSYRWTYNGTNITSATNASLVLTNVQLTQAGNYAVSISSPAGSITSSNAVLTLNGPPYFTAQPAGETNIVGATAVFSVSASGSVPLYFQWKFNGTNINGATNSLLALTNLQLPQSGNYSVLVTNSLSSALSSNATLLVIPQSHFVWAQVNSPRFVSAPFPVTIQAKNSTNGINTAFTGTVSLFSTNGIAVSPAVSSSFTNGTWSGNLVIAQTATNLVLWALDGYGEIGTANAINVVTRPGLAAAESGGNLYISWPINPSGFVLEVTTNLSSHNWFPVSTPPVQIGGQNLESISLSRTNSFYRLRFTGQ